MIVSIAVVNWPCLIVIIPCIIIFIIVFSTFRLVFPQIKRLEAITRSPVFVVCNETVDCLVSIRAFDMQDKFSKEFREASNINASLFYQ